MRHSRLAMLTAGILLFAACDAEDATTPAAPELEAAFAKKNKPGYRTAAPAQAQILVPGEMLPIATSGEVMPGSGQKLAGIPDGIGSWGGARFMNSYMNHEISGAARVSKFTIDTETGTIVDHVYTLDGSEGYSRLCSASWSDADDGFPGGYFFTGEETSNGIQLAIDAQGNVTELPQLGYYAHEQQVSIPGFPGNVVLVNFDDDGTSCPGDACSEDAESEFYMYVASNADKALRGDGQLYVFTSDDADHVGQMTVGQTIEGSWIAVPEAIATDRGPDPVTGKPPLDEWVDDPAHDAFDFTRLEDGFYDKVSAAQGEPAVYIFDTGDADLGTGGANYWDKWGSIYRMSWDNPADPAGKTYLTLLARSNGPGTGWASPDNGDMNADGVIMLQEDPAAGPWSRDETQIWAFQRAPDGSLMNPAGSLIAETVGSDCLGDSGGRCWETSGIEDASRWFGPDTWILDVQSKEPLADCPECVSNGQLLLMNVGVAGTDARRTAPVG